MCYKAAFETGKNHEGKWGQIKWGVLGHVQLRRGA